MRAVQWIRNTALVAFFLVVAGGVVLLPGEPEAAEKAPTAAAEEQAVPA